MCLQLSGTVDTIDTQDDAVITLDIWSVETVVTRGVASELMLQASFT